MTLLAKQLGRHIAFLLGQCVVANPTKALQNLETLSPPPPEWYKTRAIELVGLQQKCLDLGTPESLSALSKEIYAACHSTAAEGKLEAILAREAKTVSTILAIHKEMLQSHRRLYEDTETINKIKLPQYLTSIDREIKTIDDMVEELELQLT